MVLFLKQCLYRSPLTKRWCVSGTVGSLWWFLLSKRLHGEEERWAITLLYCYTVMRLWQDADNKLFLSRLLATTATLLNGDGEPIRADNGCWIIVLSYVNSSTIIWSGFEGPFEPCHWTVHTQRVNTCVNTSADRRNEKTMYYNQVETFAICQVPNKFKWTPQKTTTAVISKYFCLDPKGAYLEWFSNYDLFNLLTLNQDASM